MQSQSTPNVLSHREQAWELHLAGHCGDVAPTLSSSGLKQHPLEITFYFPCCGVLPSFLLSLNPALGAYCRGNSWKIMKEYLFIQGAFQGHTKTFEVTPFLFSNYVWVFSRLLRNALCKRLKPLLTALSSVFWCSVQITPSTSNQIASREKISLGMKLGSLTASFYIVIWKNHFSAAGTVPLKVVEGYNLLSSSRAGDAAQPHAQSYCFHSTEQHHLLRLRA